MNTRRRLASDPLALLSVAAVASACIAACATGVTDGAVDALDGGPVPVQPDGGADIGHPVSPEASVPDVASPQGDDASVPTADAADAAPLGDQGKVDAAADAGADSAADAGSDALVDTGVDAGSDANCGTGTILINEVQVAGAGGAEDEWVEIRNPFSCPLDLSGWSLKHTSATGTVAQTVWTAAPSTVVPPYAHAIVAGTSYTAAAKPIGSFTIGVLAPTGGGLGLYEPGGTLVDSMGYGLGAANVYVQGAPAPAPPTSESVARIPDGVTTGKNELDFSLATTPTPGAAN